MLVFFLLIQSGLIAYVYKSELFETPVLAKTVFLEVDINKTDRLELHSESGKPVVVKKNNGKWIMPDYQNLPVSKGKVEALLQKLTQSRVSAPVGTSNAVAARFGVSQTNFKRKLLLYHQGKLQAQVLIGKVTTQETHYARIENDNRIYTIRLSLDHLPAKQESWFDHQILQPELPLIRLESADFVLFQTNNEWQLDKAKKNEQLDPSQVKRLLNYIKYLQVISIEKDVDASAKPAFYFIVNDKSGMVRYDFYKRGSKLIIKSSRSALYYQLADYLGKVLVTFNRTSLIFVRKMQE